MFGAQKDLRGSELGSVIRSDFSFLENASAIKLSTILFVDHINVRPYSAQCHSSPPHSD